MSKCIMCGGHFHEENGWQEICSVECAKMLVMGEIMDEKRRAKAPVKAKRLDALWEEWWKDPNNQKRTRNGKKCYKGFGTWREVVVDVGVETKRLIRKRVNVGGEISVTPMSDKDIYACKKYRGRGCCVEDRIKEPRLPSERNAYDEIVVRDEDM